MTEYEDIGEKLKWERDGHRTNSDNNISSHTNSNNNDI